MKKDINGHLSHLVDECVVLLFVASNAERTEKKLGLHNQYFFSFSSLSVNQRQHDGAMLTPSLFDFWAQGSFKKLQILAT